MKKEDYIKLLREVQNNRKNDLIESKSLLDNYDADIKEIVNELRRDSNSAMIKFFIEFLMYYCITKNDLSNVFVIFIIILAIKNIYLVTINEIGISSINNSLNFIKDNINENELNIKKIENAICFFQTTSQDEINKYLSYKIK